MALVVAPCGLAPLGLWTPPTFPAVAHPSINLAEDIDPTTRALASTGGADPVADQVLFALQGVRGSGPALNGRGQGFARIRKNTDTVESDVKAEAQLALAPLVRAGLIRVVSYSVVSEADWWELTVTWVNLLTGAAGPPTVVSSQGTES